MKKIILIIFLILGKNIFSQELIEPNFLKYNVVPFEVKANIYNAKTSVMTLGYVPVGTSFLIGASSYFKGYVFLATCQHVIDSLIMHKNGIVYARFFYHDSTKNEKERSIRLRLNLKDEVGKNIFYSKSSCYDIAVINLNGLFGEIVDEEKTADLSKFKIKLIPISIIKTHNDTIPVLENIVYGGFPYSLSGKLQNYVIYRQGIVSAVIKDSFEDLCVGHILINTETIGGDSGSPVFLEPKIFSSKTRKLIGIVSSYYFTGLTIVQPIEEIMYIIDEFLSDKVNLK